MIGLTRRRLDELLHGVGSLQVAVVGDFFLDSYYDCDPRLDEPSLETGRPARQVVRTRRQAGAAGTVAANLVALGAHVDAVGFCGDDGEGYELRRAMEALGCGLDAFHTIPERFTPTYAKPCAVVPEGRAWRVSEEFERLDTKNRRPTPKAWQQRLAADVERGCSGWDAVVVVDQVSEAGCGVVTPSMRRALAGCAAADDAPLFLIDSRERIGLFSTLPIKPNHLEAAAALDEPPAGGPTPALDQARRLAGRRRRPVFLTLGAQGMVVCVDGKAAHVPGFPVTDRPIDPVGAGDSTTAALVSALCAGATPVEAATLANLVGSVTVQQIGTTGTAPPAAIRRRYQEVTDGLPAR
jgi:rfaE bifunctional protein kinase chain/domain